VLKKKSERRRMTARPEGKEKKTVRFSGVKRDTSRLAGRLKERTKGILKGKRI